jgi:hypothetical protein
VIAWCSAGPDLTRAAREVRAELAEQTRRRRSFRARAAKWPYDHAAHRVLAERTERHKVETVIREALVLLR